MTYTDDVESIGFAPAACRGGGTCLNDRAACPLILLRAAVFPV
jgi:hypothetical protein